MIGFFTGHQQKNKSLPPGPNCHHCLSSWMPYFGAMCRWLWMSGCLWCWNLPCFFKWPPIQDISQMWQWLRCLCILSSTWRTENGCKWCLSGTSQIVAWGSGVTTSRIWYLWFSTGFFQYLQIPCCSQQTVDGRKSQTNQLGCVPNPVNNGRNHMDQLPTSTGWSPFPQERVMEADPKLRLRYRHAVATLTEERPKDQHPRILPVVASFCGACINSTVPLGLIGIVLLAWKNISTGFIIGGDGLTL